MPTSSISNKICDSFPNGRGAVIVMSGGMDSTIAARFAVDRYGSENVHALSFFYGQKQSVELELAKENSTHMGIENHTIVDMSFFGDMVRGVCANIQGGLVMPTIRDVLGDPAPVTEVPFRNGIMFMLAAAYAQSNDLNVIVTGVQATDQYSYFDTTPAFVEGMNAVIGQNRKHNIKIFAPWQGVDKATEIQALIDLDGEDDAMALLRGTLTCYNPQDRVSCGNCPSCAERIMNFKRAGFIDPIEYAVPIDWGNL